MKKLKNYAIAAIAISTIALSGAGQRTFMTNEFSNFFSTNQKDTLSTGQFIQQLSIASAKEINLAKLAKKNQSIPI